MSTKSNMKTILKNNQEKKLTNGKASAIIFGMGVRTHVQEAAVSSVMEATSRIFIKTRFYFGLQGNRKVDVSSCTFLTPASLFCFASEKANKKINIKTEQEGGQYVHVLAAVIPAWIESLFSVLTGSFPEGLFTPVITTNN